METLYISLFFLQVAFFAVKLRFFLLFIIKWIVCLAFDAEYIRVSHLFVSERIFYAVLEGVIL